MSTLYTLDQVKFSYRLGKQKMEALRGVSCEIRSGDFICISGPSGSGKSTLLNLLGPIETPQEGKLLFCGRELSELEEGEKNQIRKYEIGFVFQNFHLFPVLSAYENVAYFLTRQGMRARDRSMRVRKSLEAVGLWEHRHKKPLEISGGQRQRVAIARALAKKPQVIVADEPTASLDQKTGKEIMNLFTSAHREYGASLIVSSHDPMVQAYCPTRLHLVDGKLNLPASEAVRRMAT